MIAVEALRRALCTTFATIERHESWAWASTVFSGERHRLILRFAGEGAAAQADRFVDGLAEREFALEGHILADILLVAEARDAQAVRLILEALTIAAD
ncbi:MAG: hypothetical protein QOH47_1004 [Sphingomonadales bacterium]|jgi:hypothetical protein|nr:hypothetical protein [Sphingomonadales bacterium]